MGRKASKDHPLYLITNVVMFSSKNSIDLKTKVNLSFEKQMKNSLNGI